MKLDPRAGTLAAPAELLDVAALTRAFFDRKPDMTAPGQRVTFGTSGHRGCAFDSSFNENHVLAITQAICRHRAGAGIDGPLFVGRDSHAVSEPAFRVCLEVLGANGVTTMVDAQDSFTPTPAVSHAILRYNRGRGTGLADGIVITPSHNPPEDGGFKYNPPHGGPAESAVTSAIERDANALLEAGLAEVKRGAAAATPHDYIAAYVADLENILDLKAVAASGLRIGVDPLGGAAVHYWAAIAQRYGIALAVTDASVDPTFGFVPRDWDGKIRMDCSSPYPMKRLIAVKDKFDIAFANDTDADRHGIVTAAGLMPPNNYLATCAFYLGQNRAVFGGRKIGKTLVSSSMIDRVAAKLGTSAYEVPVGFKWFVDGLMDGSLYFAGEESAGSSFLRSDGSVWTTDKDGLIAGLLAAEMTVRTGKTPDKIFAGLEEELGTMFYARKDSPAGRELRTKISRIRADAITAKTLGGDAIVQKLSEAPGNGAAIGGIKLVTANGWIAARPSGTEDIYKIYAESFVSAGHLAALQSDAESIVAAI